MYPERTDNGETPSSLRVTPKGRSNQKRQLGRWCGTVGIAALAFGWLPSACAQSDEYRPFAVNACVGQHVQTVIQDDYRRGLPDRAIGDTPAILHAPGGRVIGHLAVWTSYKVGSPRGGYALLCGTRFSEPFAPGQTVGWIKASEVHSLALRNCA